jgi:uncharacterized protein YcbX
MPAVTLLSVTPVKGLALHHPAEVELTAAGIPGDRRFHLVRRGRLYSAPAHGPLATIVGVYDADTDELELRFPDGRTVRAAVEVEGEPVATDFYGRPVTGRKVTGPFAAALSRFTRHELDLIRVEGPAGGWDCEPVTILSAESVAELAERAGLDTVDGRRFRMNVEIEGCAAAHEEDSWAGRLVRVGGAVVRVGEPVPRCVNTTRDPSTGLRDLDTLRVIKGYRGLRDGSQIDFGVYAEVVEPGRVRTGDPVEPL